MNYVPIDSITPNRHQPRRRFDQESLLSLSDSIAELGILQPVLVRVLDADSYELIAGERRWRAAELAGLEAVPVIIRCVDDKESLEQAVVENLHREDLNPMEEAAAYQRLIDEFSLSAEKVAVRVGKSRPAIVNSLRLFQLSLPIQKFVVEGQLSAGHARTLLGLTDLDSRQNAAERAVREVLSVRALERLVKRWEAAPRPDAGDSGRMVALARRSPALLEVESRLADQLSTRVSAALPQQGPGRLVIEFADLEDLGRIFDELIGDSPFSV